MPRAGQEAQQPCSVSGKEDAPRAGTLARSSHRGGEAGTLSSGLLGTGQVVLEKRRLQDDLTVAFQCLKGLQESWRGTFDHDMQWEHKEKWLHTDTGQG